MLSLDGLHKVGEDSLNNLFDVNIGLPSFISLLIPSGMSIGDLPLDGGSFLRVESVTMPEPSVNMYENHYKTLDIERVSGKMERPKEFTMTCRNDRFYVLYHFLTFWRNWPIDVSNGAMGNDGKIPGTSSSFRLPITISPCDVTRTTDGASASADVGAFIADNEGKLTNWIFSGCFPKTVGAITYDYSDGEKTTFDVTFGFLEMTEFLT